MSSMQYSISSELLTWSEFGQWSAKSGPYGLGSLPQGQYKVERRNITPLTSKMKNGFIDKTTGKGYFVPITPLFDALGRDGFGIHPDGGKYIGTKGCIGITSNSSGFYQSISSTAASSNLTLEVIN